jgi:CelD/BcsL family acetyltransferase involved in cellulose biosynthesis
MAFGQERKLHVLAFWNDHRLVGLAPMSIVSRPLARGQRLSVLELMGDGSGDSDNLQFLVAAGWEEAFAQALLEHLEKHKALWDIVELNTMPVNSAATDRILALLRRASWTAFECSRPASAITLPASWEEYLEQLSSENRKNLTRYLRRLEKRYKTRFCRCLDAAELSRCLDALFRLHQARWEEQGARGSFACRERRAFYFELSRALLARGWLEFWVLELDGEIASAQYAFRYRSSVFQLQEGNDPAHTSDRVGFLLRAHAIRQMIAEGVRKYDFLGGEPGYKAGWGAKKGHYRDLHFARPYTRGAIFLLLVHSAREGKKWLRQRSPKAAWNLLHRINIALKQPQRKTSS